MVHIMALKRYILHIAVMVLIMSNMAGSARADSRYDYFFQGAMVRISAGDYPGARDLLLHCRDINPQASETYFFLADCYENAGQDSLKMAMLTRAAELDPDNVTYKEALLPILLQNNELDKAVAYMEGMVHDTPERTDLLNILLQIYNYQKDTKHALETLNRLETQDGQSEQLTMSKVQIYTDMGDDKRALKELELLVKNHPLDLNYRVMLGNWLLGKDRKKEALKEYKAVLKEEPDNENALLSIMDYYRSIGEDSVANMQRDNIIFSQKTQSDTRMLLLKQYIRQCEQDQVDSTKVLQYLDRAIAVKQSATDLWTLKLAYMTMKQMPKDSIKSVLYQILDLQPDNASARFELIQMAWENQDSKEMIRLAKPAQQYNPDEWAFSYFLGVGYFINDDIEECINALQTAAANVDESRQAKLAEDMYALLGDALYKVDKNDEAFQAYENCLRLNPDNIMCLNNYAYYLSEVNGDLDRAATMSLKTVKEEPNNSTYLDTYAWILYLQGRYEEAKIYIDMAVKNLEEDKDNTVILNHQKEIDAKLNTKH